jgi:hypothetical protein
MEGIGFECPAKSRLTKFLTKYFTNFGCLVIARPVGFAAISIVCSTKSLAAFMSLVLSA